MKDKALKNMFYVLIKRIPQDQQWPRKRGKNYMAVSTHVCNQFINNCNKSGMSLSNDHFIEHALREKKKV